MNIHNATNKMPTAIHIVDWWVDDHDYDIFDVNGGGDGVADDIPYLFEFIGNCTFVEFIFFPISSGYF